MVKNSKIDLIKMYSLNLRPKGLTWYQNYGKWRWDIFDINFSFQDNHFLNNIQIKCTMTSISANSIMANVKLVCIIEIIHLNHYIQTTKLKNTALLQCHHYCPNLSLYYKIICSDSSARNSVVVTSPKYFPKNTNLELNPPQAFTKS